MPLIMTDICKSFGEKKVLDGFSLDLPDGGRACILGPSGGGKSTLLNIIAELTKPDSGRIECSYTRIAYVFQEYRLLPWLTAKENITAVSGCGSGRACELLEAMELGGDIDSYPDSLSGGMKQRVNIARALAFEPELLLMDEPFKGLDMELRERIVHKILEYHNGALILVTHDKMECELMKCSQMYEFGEIT